MTHTFQTQFVTKCYCINKDNQILVLKKGIHEKHGPGSWDLPGGGVERIDQQDTINNIFINNIARELQEECSILLKNEKPQIIHQKTSEQDNGIKIFQFYIINFDYTPHIILSTEHTEYQWISKEEFSKLDFHLSECNYGNHPPVLMLNILMS